MILGIDEVGRGPWAGPLVVGAVVLGDGDIPGLTDSKALSAKRRESLATQIHQSAAAVGLGWVHAEEIDEVGLSEALRLATRRAVETIHAPYHEIILDGTVNFLAGTNKARFVTVLPKADALIPAVSAASIVAKVARDAYMTQQDEKYPGYLFASNAGYGTKAHRLAIQHGGVTPLHRLSFAPLAEYRPTPNAQSPSIDTSRQIGDRSEAAAAQWLESQGHTVIERNWRTKYCEIDIVSEYDQTLFFTEVKHRRSARSGDGTESITPQKLAQMTRAAALYTARSQWGSGIKLAVIATSGESATPHIERYLEIE